MDLKTNRLQQRQDWSRSVSRMDASLFIARRLRFRRRIVTASVAISFLVMILAVSISSGFRYELREGISAMTGDIQITPPDQNVLDESSPIEADPEYKEAVLELDAVEQIHPVVYKTGIVKAGDNVHGVLFKGVESGMPDSLSLHVSIPRRLSEITSLKEGDKMLAYFVGEKVRMRNFTISSVHDVLVEADDRLVVTADIKDMQRLLGWNDSQASAMEVMLDPGHRNVGGIMDASMQVGAIVSSYSENSESPVIAVSSVSRFPQIFDWLDLIDFNVLFILVLMTIVAGFNMISGLLIMLFENISTIGLLKSLGMTDRAIAKVFLASSSVLTAKGMAVGNILALLFCFVQQKTHLIPLDPENYFVSFVPVHVDMAMILTADIISFAVIMLLLLIPCLFISKVDPADTVRVR